jgi:hypothetical protein
LSKRSKGHEICDLPAGTNTESDTLLHHFLSRDRDNRNRDDRDRVIRYGEIRDRDKRGGDDRSRELRNRYKWDRDNMDRNNLKGENATETAGTGQSAGIGQMTGRDKTRTEQR